MSTRRANAVPKAHVENRERRSPRILRTKTPSVNELRKKFKVSPKGKRKLNFQYKSKAKAKGPLHGKSFYLDLKGYRHSTQLKKAIGELSGGIEEFFHKDVSYLVTNRRYADSGKSPSSHSTPSPGTPSPFLITRSSSLKGAAIPSPMSTDSPQDIDSRQAKASHNTRGQAIFKRISAGQKRGTTDVLSNAATWGVNVLHIEQVLKWISQLMPKARQHKSVKEQPSAPSSIKGALEGKVPKVIPLHDTFLKVEDLSFKYRPLFREFKVWPQITFDNSVTSPFDPPKRRSEKNTTKRKTEVETKSVKKVSMQKRAKNGFCECCEVRYTDLKSHLRDDQHQTFARTDSNYASLDKAIDEGPNIQDFLNELRRKKSKDRPSAVENKLSLSICDEKFDEVLNDEVFLMSSPHVSRKNDEPSGENSLNKMQDGLNVALTAGTDVEENGNQNDVHRNLINNDTAVNEKTASFAELSCLAVDNNKMNEIEKPARVTRSQVSPKLQVVNPVDERQNLSEASCNQREDNPKTGAQEGSNEEDVTIFRVSERVRHRTRLNNSVNKPTEEDEKHVSQHPSTNSDKSINDESVRITDRNSSMRRRAVDALKLSPILPCNPTVGAGSFFSCSGDADFLPSGLPIYSSLGSSPVDFSKNLNSLVRRTTIQSNSENMDPNGPQPTSSPVRPDFSLAMSSVELCPGAAADVKGSPLKNHNSKEHAENSVFQVSLAFLDSGTITGHNRIANENDDDSPLVKRKRSHEDQGHKARKCKRLSEYDGSESERAEFSSGYTSEDLGVINVPGYRLSVAERVKLQRAMSESLQEYNNMSKCTAEEPPSSAPQVEVAIRKRRNVFTSSPFVEVTNTCEKGRKRAKSDGRLGNFGGKTEWSLNNWNEKPRGKHPRSACLIPNDPFSFNAS